MQDLGRMRRAFPAVVRAVTELRPAYGALLMDAEVGGFEGDTLVVNVRSEFSERMLGRGDAGAFVGALMKAGGIECPVEFRAEPRVSVPAARYAQLRETEWHMQELMRLVCGEVPGDAR